MQVYRHLFVLFSAVCIIGVFAVAQPQSANAHDVFKAPMQERFKLKTVSCSACHPGKDKHVHNRFGAMFVKVFKGKNLSAQLEAAEAKGEKEKEEFEAVMVEEFKIALAALEKKEPMVFAMVDAGMLVGTKKTPEGLEEAQAVTDAYIEADMDVPLFESHGVDGDAEAAKPTETDKGK